MTYSPLTISSLLKYTPLIMLLLILAACARPAIVAEYPDQSDGRSTISGGSLLDNFRNAQGALTISGGSGAGTGAQASLAVNSDLWLASLDSLSFLPLASANPEGGVIITDWYEDNSNPAPRTRLKINVVIVGKDLRADNLRLAVFRQQRISGEWRAMGNAKALARQLENIILAKARELKLRRANP